MTDQPSRNLHKFGFPSLTNWLTLLGLLILLAMGAYFRWVGLDWDDEYHLHPDERFLTMVTSDIASPSWDTILADQSDSRVGSQPGSIHRLVTLLTHWQGYFDTANSSLNPHNRGYGFYVYGTFPLFLVRYTAEWFGLTGYSENYLLGRKISALFDLGTVLLVFLTALRLLRKKWVALLAAAFAACSVLPIQHAHFYVVDTFANFFIYFAIYFAILIVTYPEEKIQAITMPSEEVSPTPTEGHSSYPEPSTVYPADSNPISLGTILRQKWGEGLLYIGFAVASGLALACKISAAPVVLLLPAAAVIRYYGLAKEQRKSEVFYTLRNLLIAGVVALVIFRVFQPYAFEGPGFFGLHLNEKWLSNLKTLSSQSNGDVEFPPALQWARRPLTFAWENMVRFGLGIPLGIFAWFSFLWLGWRIIKGERAFLLIWAWTAVYFTWQSVSFVKSMRYQLPVYPSLALIAAWGISALWNGGYTRIKILSWLNKGKLYQWLTIIVSAGVLLSTAAWAFAFTRIYTEPVTRVAATEWVYQNIPAAFNLKIDTEEGQYNLPVAYQLGTRISHSQPMIIAFRPKAAGIVNKIQITHIADRANRSSSVKVLIGVISEDAKGDLPLANAVVSDAFLAEADDERGQSYDLVFMQPPYLEVGNTYYLTLATTSDELPLDVYGQIILYLSSYDGSRVQSLGQPVRALKPGETYSTTFRSPKGGSIRTIYLPRVIDWQADPSKKRIKVEISGETEGTAVLESDFDPFVNPMESGFWLSLDHPVEVKPDTIYVFRLTYESGDGIIAVYGSQITRESTWDDVVPMGMDGLDAWDYNHGLYQSDLNFEMYWDDTTAKLDRFQSILDQADTIIITSNRQYGTTARVPERYPLTSAFYRNLLGCPADESIITCYYQAEPGMYNGSLGYQLVQVFQSEPRLGQWTFNTQFAEEAFTVYDHPKVLIFRKQADYNPESVREILSSVDLSLVVNVTPGKVKSYPANIQLPDERFQQQISGGTWSQYFNQTFIYNRYPILALILWYFAVSVLGWVVYPMVRLAFRGLADRGMTFIRMAGLLLLAYPVWVAGSIGVPFTRNTIFLAFFLLALINLGLFWTRKNEILEELRSRKKQIILIEILALLFFTFFLMIRLGNPDLWHQYKGGEKPMDFSYFNAVLKSTSFPPYDPWFAGGYINYYYYGFVLVGVPVKALGIMPSVAFNLILPTFFSLYAMGAFGIGWNLLANGNHETRKDMSSSTNTDVADEQVFEPSEKKVSRMKRLISDWLPMIQEKTFIAGIAASVFALIVGNLGTIRMIWHGLIRLVVSGEQLDQAGAIQLWLWSFQGLGKFLSGVPLPYGLGDWYWIPSRAIPGEPITEFPFFTFLYADPHAHLYALPVTLFVLGWCLAVLKQRCALNKPFWFEGLLSIFIGSLAVGSLRAINTWDMPTFLLLSVFVIGYTIFRYYQNISQSPSRLRALVVTLIAIVVFVGLSFFLYRPYTQWYAPGYQSIEIWNGGHTPFWSYITHWGLYLFFILSWLVRETIDWMAKTPLSSVRKLRPYRGLIAIMVVGLIVSILYLVKRGVSISWFVLPLAVWAGILILRPNQPDLKRFVLFCVGTALVLTLAVELIVLKGDIGRMNTVFKFYLQAWSLFSISAAVSFVWLIHPLLSAPRKKNISGWQNAWLGAGMVLLAGALMFPIMGGSAKIRDRMAPEALHTLDGMAYMQYAYYYDQDTVFDLSQDYQAIRWMQDHVIGSPVIVEGNTPEYRWGSRFTIYTGLPGVVGWNWHQRQQRALTPSSWVTDRIYDIEQFYTTTDRYLTEVFLKKYKVNYIVVGQLEKAYYPGMGLEKFEDWNGDLWTEVYRYKDTVIYEVIKE